MKKILAFLLAATMLLSLAACTQKAETPADTTAAETAQPTDAAQNSDAPDTNTEETEAESTPAAEDVSGNLVVYSTMGDAEYELFVGSFLEKYPNVTVDCVNGGAGELKTRIAEEAGNPQGDVMLGGLVYVDALTKGDLFEEYVSPNDANMPESVKNTTGKVSWITTQVVNLIINKEKLAEFGVEVTGYEDLLQPELKGQIIAADPTSTSSGWNNLAAMLTVMGNGDASSEAGWDYVTKLIANLDGKISSSSSKVYKSVYEGEYPVGITYEGPCVTYKDDGVGDGIDIVYMKEGTTVTPFGAAIIKDAKNMDLAKVFIDWITSDECQGMLAASVQRGANMNIPTTNPNLLDASKIKFVDSDPEYLATHQSEIQEKWTELWTAAYGSNTVDIAG